MDERSDRGDFYPGGNGGGGVPPGTDTDKVDRISLGEVGESYTLKDVKNKVNQIVRAIAPVAVCLAGLALCVAGLCASTSRAATAPLEDIPNTAPVVTNEEDAVAMAAMGALGEALSNDVAELSSAFNARLGGATNALTVQMAALRSADSNRIEATYAKLADIPAQPDLSPYALKSELPQDYLTENDITNLATRAWIAGQGYATQAGVGARLDAQDLAIDAATNALWLAHAAGQARLVAATNALWSATLHADEALQRAIDGIRIVAADSNAVTRLVTDDGYTWQDATGTVWRVTVTRVCTDALEEWTYTIDGQTYTYEQMMERAGGGGFEYSQTLYWNDSSFYGKDEEDVQFAGWYVIDGSGTAPVGYDWTTGIIPSYASDQYLAEVAYYNGITATRGKLVYVTNAIDRVLYASGGGGGGSADLTPATNYTDQVAARKQEWRVVETNEYEITFITNGMLNVVMTPMRQVDCYTNGWPDGAAMFVRFRNVYDSGYDYNVQPPIRLVGYGAWPTNDFQSVWWRSGTNIFVNVLVEEGP